MTTTTAIIINGVLMAGVVGALVAGHLWALATQHRDHGVRAAGPVLRRRIWSRSARPHAGSRKPLFAENRRRQPLTDF